MCECNLHRERKRMTLFRLSVHGNEWSLAHPVVYILLPVDGILSIVTDDLDLILLLSDKLANPWMLKGTRCGFGSRHTLNNMLI